MPARLPIRIAAWFLDLLITFFVTIAFAAVAPVRIVLAVTVVLLFVYRRMAGATPGEQIIGTRMPWLRAAAGAMVILYLGIMLGAASLISHLTDEKIVASRVDTPAVETTVPFRTGGGVRHEFAAVAFETPVTANGAAIEVANCCLFFGGHADPDRVDAGILIFVDGSLHPYDYCTGTTIAAANRLAGCRETPADFQRSIIDTNRGSRWKVWNPIGVVRTNFALVAKNIYLEDLAPGEPIRHFKRETAEVHWFRGQRQLTKKLETVNVEMDRFLIADGTRYAGVDILWKKVPRDGELAHLIASSLRMRGATGTVDSGGGTVIGLMNAFRTDPARSDVADALRKKLSTAGTARERRYFALVVADRAKRDGKLLPVAASVETWR